MTEIRNINELIPYDENPRINEDAVQGVLESLKRHGQVKPLVISAKGKPFENEIICCGHTTLKALQEFGATEIKVEVVEFDDESAFVDLMIRDNKTSEAAGWDVSKLKELEIKNEIVLEEIGFDFDDPGKEGKGDGAGDGDENFTAVIKIKCIKDQKNNVKGVISNALREFTDIEIS